MKTDPRTSIIEGNEHNYTNQGFEARLENKIKVTSANLIRWSGLAAMVAGILYIGIQLIHPPDNLSSVITGAGAMASYLTIAMALLALIGTLGIYARQVSEAGWIGLIGYFLFSLFWIATTVFTFAEAFILPLVAADVPKFVEGFLGIFSGYASEVNLGFLPAFGRLGALLYILGGILFSIATLRAGILPRWAAGVLAFGALAPLAASLLGHPLDRILAVPMGLALIFLGYALLFEKRKKV
ncbi:hypothetical protein [Bacillus sp. FJAT-27225]|uniref:hypothetical protein n=1 Tax=Bacillus sp. FJAT-27225 TaxID=1743144 RepID=UPI0020C7A5D8|nr:hypothetical protein [Bacillus sp. FJAT-27225]